MTGLRGLADIDDRQSVISGGNVRFRWQQTFTEIVPMPELRTFQPYADAAKTAATRRPDRVARRIGAAVFPEAAVRCRQNAHSPKRKFSALVSDVSLVDKAKIDDSPFTVYFAAIHSSWFRITKVGCSGTAGIVAIRH